MLFKSIRPLGLLVAGLFAAACQQDSTAPSLQADAGLEAAISQMEADAGDAVRSGDADRAERLNAGASALRRGIRPTQIEVKIKGESYRYLAIMVGVVRVNPAGERVLFRNLFAWNGKPPKAVLEVAAKADHGVFGHPAIASLNDEASPLEGARGRWKDLVNHERWAATSGFANMVLVGTGDPCPVQPADAARRCFLAKFDIRIDGRFQLLLPDGPSGDAIEITTAADGVNGVVLKPAD